MIVNARSQKTCVPERIFFRAILKVRDDFGFGKWPRKLQRFAQAIALRNALEKVVDGFCANRREHFLALGWAFRKITHQAEASLPFCATNASYAAASIKLF